MRSYSLSSAPDAATYRISVKREAHGLVSGYVHSRLRPGAFLDVAAPRGEFVLNDEASPVLLVSRRASVSRRCSRCCINLRLRKTKRDVWWIHTARDAIQHAFAGEAHELLPGRCRAPSEHLFYTAAAGRSPSDARSSSGARRLAALGDLGLPRTAAAYICGPAAS